MGLGLTAPETLKVPSTLWWRIVFAFGWLNTRIFLTLLFGLIFIPLGLFWRTTGRDPLMQRRQKFKGWSVHPSRYTDKKHYERMY